MLLALLTISIYGTKSEDDEASVESENLDDSIVKPEEDPVPYISPDIDHSVYFADHFDSEEAFEAKWIKSSAKKDGVDTGIDR